MVTDLKISATEAVVEVSAFPDPRGDTFSTGLPDIAYEELTGSWTKDLDSVGVVAMVVDVDTVVVATAVLLAVVVIVGPFITGTSVCAVTVEA